MPTRVFDEKCKFRYNEAREGATKKGAGQHTLYNRCILQKTENKKCLHPNENQTICPFSTAPKHRHKGKVKLRGKWRKT